MNVLEAMDLAKAGKRVRRKSWPVGVRVQFLDLNTMLGGYVVRMVGVPDWSSGGSSRVDLPSGYLRVVADARRTSAVEIERWGPKIDDMEAQDWEVVGDPTSPAVARSVSSADVPTINPDVVDR